MPALLPLATNGLAPPAAISAATTCHGGATSAAAAENTTTTLLGCGGCCSCAEVASCVEVASAPNSRCSISCNCACLPVLQIPCLHPTSVQCSTRLFGRLQLAVLRIALPKRPPGTPKRPQENKARRECPRDHPMRLSWLSKG